jgi:hypothetical protein
MDLFVLFGDGAITRKNIIGTYFASCATRNDADYRYFFSGDTPSPEIITTKKSFLE